jgi:hypothetical protein
VTQSETIAIVSPVRGKVDSDLDKGIGENFDAVLVRHKRDSAVKYDVKNGASWAN